MRRGVKSFERLCVSFDEITFKILRDIANKRGWKLSYAVRVCVIYYYLVEILGKKPREISEEDLLELARSFSERLS